jgi:hypothetical protein
MARQRLTWKQTGASRSASAPPAVPNEGPASPAYTPDPEADAYENGDTSSWAEDPHPGPYKNGPYPAVPNEGPASPAYKEAALVRRLERKASICYKLAGYIAGPNASEDLRVSQAVSYMDLSDRALAAAIARFAGEDTDEVEEEVEVEEAKKKASSKTSTRAVKALLNMIAEDESDDDTDEDTDEVEEEVEVEEAKKKASSKTSTRAKIAEAEKALEKAEGDLAEAEEAPTEAKKKAALRKLARAVAAADEAVSEAADAAAEDEEDKKKSASLVARIRRDFNSVRNAFYNLRRFAEEKHDEAEEKHDEAEEKHEAKKKASPRKAQDIRKLAETDPEAALEAMLAEEGMLDEASYGHTDHEHMEYEASEGVDPEVEAMLAELFEDDSEASTHEDHEASAPAEAMFEDDLLEMDPLGVLVEDDGAAALTDDDLLMASMFGQHLASADNDASTSRTASSNLRPRPKTAPTGVTRLGGGVQRTAADEVNDLSKIWEPVPDVRKFF